MPTDTDRELQGLRGGASGGWGSPLVEGREGDGAEIIDTDPSHRAEERDHRCPREDPVSIIYKRVQKGKLQPFYCPWNRTDWRRFVPCMTVKGYDHRCKNGVVLIKRRRLHVF